MAKSQRKFFQYKLTSPSTGIPYFDRPIMCGLEYRTVLLVANPFNLKWTESSITIKFLQEQTQHGGQSCDLFACIDTPLDTE